MQSTSTSRTLTVLIAEDDPDDRVLLEDAFSEARLDANLLFVDHGEALLRYLRRELEYIDRALFPDPDLILLDLNMPRKNGREALAEIKGDEKLRHIPTIVLTTSRAEDDIASSYAVGANSYIVKPTTFSGLVEMAEAVRRYWLDMVDLPIPRVESANPGQRASSAEREAVRPSDGDNHNRGLTRH